MRKWLLGLALLLGLGSSASAGVSCSVPFQLQNGTTADASQVMANYNAILACLANNTAASGANNDITSLSALSTPISPIQGGSSVFYGTTSGGTANAQTITVTPSVFSLVNGYTVVFTAGFNNTGPTTLSVNGGAATNIYRRSQLGLTAVEGGELQSGIQVILTYDGTQFELMSQPPIIIGEIKDFIGTVAPPGYLFMDGSCQLQATYPDLYSLYPGSGCSAGSFALPDARGRVTAALDNQGTNGNASRLNAYCSSTASGAGCGAQNELIGRTNLPNVTFNLSITGTLAISTYTGAFNDGQNAIFSTLQGTNALVSNVPYSGLGGTAASGGSGTPFATVQPTLMTTKIIHY